MYHEFLLLDETYGRVMDLGLFMTPSALMKRRPLNSVTLVTATHKELVRASDGTGTQVGVRMINKCRAQMIKEGLYNM